MRTSVPNVDLRPDHWAIVRRALQRHVADREVLAFGSRATWTAKDYSDLDLAVMGEEPLSLRTVSALDEALGDSDLPFKVDVVDWARIDEAFRAIIRQSAMSVQVPTMTPAMAGRVRVAAAIRVAAAPPSCAWREVAIGEIADIVGGGTPSTKNAKNFGGSIPWLTPRDLSGTHDRYIGHGERNLSRRGLDGSSAKLLPVGTVLLSTRAPIGYVALAKNPIASNQGFRSLVVRDGILPEFLYYWLKVNTEELERHASGSTFRELSGSSLKDIRLDLPPTDEQRAIAHILGTLDDKIELNRRMNETLEAMARALFKSWFVDFDPVRAKMEGRDPGLPLGVADHFPDRMADSEMGEMPEGWEVVTLGDIAALRRKGVDPASEAINTPYIGLADMPRGSIALPNWGATGSVSSRKSVFKAGDIQFGKLRPYFHMVGIAPVDGLCSTDIVVLGARQPKWSALVLACVSSAALVAHTSQTATGTKMPRTSWKAMSRYELCRPTDAIATEFQRIVSPMLLQIVGNIHESRTLAALRDALLPKLISGEIRAREASKVEAVA